MRPWTKLRAATAALATAGAAAGLSAVVGTGVAHAATPFPAHVFAPYFEAYSSDDPAVVAQNSGAKYLSMAFLQTASSGSCTVDWNGSTSQPIGSTFASSIATIRSRGGDVIPSFGGYTADTTNTEIADSCTSVGSIASAIENVISTYDLSRIDFDVEQNSLTNSAGIDRRNKALAQVESWAASNSRPLQVSYTLPTNPTGLDSGGTGVLQNAVSNGTRVDVVNIMTFDYYTGTSHEMATETENAASGLVSQLASLYPSKTSQQLWSMVGVTEMPGIDDYGAGETFTQADAGTVYNWAVSKGIDEISMWASERDNGGCPGTGGSDTCSGISQPTWYFSDQWDPFTSSSAPANDFSLTLSPASGSVTAGSSLTSTVSTAVTSGSGESVALSASGLPSGATASFAPSSVTSGSSSTLTISTASTTAAGTYPLTITGTAASGTHTSTYSLTVGSGSGGGSTEAIVNGGFESGSFTGWTAAGAHQAIVTTPVHSGTHAAMLGNTSPTNGDSTLAQTFTAPTGSTTVSFWYDMNCPDDVTYDWADATLKDNTANTTTTMLAKTCTLNAGWKQVSSSVTPGHSYTITLLSHDENNPGDATDTVYDDVSCAGSGGTPANDFSLSVAPTSASVTQGSAATATVSTAVTSGSGESVALSASGLPSGATASFAPSSVTSGSSSTLTISTASTTAAGTYPLTITGTAASGSHTATFTLTVTAAGGSTNAIVNGGFESGSFTGWTTAGAHQAIVTTPVHSGTHAAMLGNTSPTNGDSTVAQTFTAPSGASKVGFWYDMNCPDDVTYDWADATLKDNTANTTTTMLAKTCTLNAGWVNVTAAITPGHSYTVTLLSHDENNPGDPTDTVYDDVTTS